jgi:TonB-like protein
MGRRNEVALLLGMVGVMVSFPLARGQNRANGHVVITKLSPPVLSQIARMANVSGEVVVDLYIEQDGAVKSAAVVSGPRILQDTALESARSSQFECKNCASGMQYSLVYAFIVNQTACSVTTNPTVTITGNQVIVTRDSFEICDAGGPSKVRSVKCLFLWKCAYHRF